MMVGRASVLVCVVVVVGLLAATAHAAYEVTSEYNNHNQKQYCEVYSCAKAQRRNRVMRLQQLAIESAARHLSALHKHMSTSSVFGVTSIFPTRGPVQGGTKVHVCGFGFQAWDKARFGDVTENRIHCFFRLDQARMTELGAFYGVNSATENSFIDHEPLYGQPGIYKPGVRSTSPGNLASFADPLTATEEHYSHLLTSYATFVNEREIICETPSIADIPIGFPVEAQVTVSINGKEQFHQWEGAGKPVFTFYDQRPVRDGLSTVHTFKSNLGRKRLDSFQNADEEDLEVIRAVTPDIYTGLYTGQFEQVVDSQGLL